MNYKQVLSLNCTWVIEDCSRTNSCIYLIKVPVLKAPSHILKCAAWITFKLDNQIFQEFGEFLFQGNLKISGQVILNCKQKVLQDNCNQL